MRGEGGEEGEAGVKHNVKMTLFSAKIVWTSSLTLSVRFRGSVTAECTGAS